MTDPTQRQQEELTYLRVTRVFVVERVGDTLGNGGVALQALVLDQLVGEAEGSLPGLVDAAAGDLGKVLVDRFVLVGDEAEQQEHADRSHHQQEREHEEAEGDPKRCRVSSILGMLDVIQSTLIVHCSLGKLAVAPAKLLDAFVAVNLPIVP